MQNFSCIIIGAGPAGLQAALFLGRASVSSLVIGIPDKSDLSYGRAIGNYFGLLDEAPGKILLQNAIAQIKKYGIDMLTEEVVDLEKLDNGKFRVVTETRKEFLSEFLIIASGQAYTRSGIQNEDKFFGNGVHTCVACDGIFYKGRKVAVIGSGSHAAQEAIELATYTKDISIYTQGDKPSWSKELNDFLREKGIVIKEERIKTLKGDTHITDVIISDNREEKINGIFIALGSASSVTFAYKLGLGQKDGFLVIDREGKTNVKGVWAAGGATGGNAQIAKSIGEGCNAALGVIRKIKGLAQYLDQT